MRNPLVFRKATIDRLFMLPRIHVGQMLLIEKRTVVRWLFYLGILMAFYGTLDPWFMWVIYRYYVLFSFLPIAVSLLLFRNISNPLYCRKDYIYPIATCSLLLLVMTLIAGKNINGIFMVFFSSIIYFSLFRLDIRELYRLGDFLSTSLACLLSISIPFYILYLVGFPLPHYHTSPEGLEYAYENYYFFLLDDRFNFEIIPRFHSVFLEPSHLGMACIALLFCQIGKWSTWRCRILFLALFMTFSLAAYICLIPMLFLSAWMKGKAVVGKIIMLASFCIAIVVGSIFYNKGDNMINQLIVQRLTYNKNGELEGDNRTTDLFTREYEKLSDSSDILFGKGSEEMHKFGFGNSGYRVFIYTNGLISIFFLIIFFYAFMRTSKNRRAKIALLIIQGMSFIAHGMPLKFYFFIPLYILTFSDVYPNKLQLATNEQDGCN